MKTTKTGTGLTHSVIVHGLCLPLADQLICRYHGEAGGYLLFPHRGAVKRVSEQESRIVLCNLLERSGRYYSVETPTTGTDFVNLGLRGMRARADITVHARGASAPGDAEMPRVLNIELKAHLPPTSSFKKDLNKLAKEGIPGLWFHTLESTDAGTLPALATRMRLALNQLANAGVAPTHDISFAICVLKKRELHTGLLTAGQLAPGGEQEPRRERTGQLDRFFDGSLSAWQVHRFDALRRAARLSG